MTKKDMIDLFSFDRSSLNKWENNEGAQDPVKAEGRKLLYHVLEKLPRDYVEKVALHLKNEKALTEGLAE